MGLIRGQVLIIILRKMGVWRFLLLIAFNLHLTLLARRCRHPRLIHQPNYPTTPHPSRLPSAS